MWLAEQVRAWAGESETRVPAMPVTTLGALGVYLSSPGLSLLVHR